MFIDASALVAVLAGEPDGIALATRLRAAERRYTSSIAVYEVALGLLRIRRTTFASITTLLDAFIAQSRIEIIPVSAEIGRLAVEASARFGRGRHPARLNMGDCFAYACARHLGVPLLCKGDDFAQTDIRLA